MLTLAKVAAIAEELKCPEGKLVNRPSKATKSSLTTLSDIHVSCKQTLEENGVLQKLRSNLQKPAVTSTITSGSRRAKKAQVFLRQTRKVLTSVTTY